jgi:hypothetical protein
MELTDKHGPTSFTFDTKKRLSLEENQAQYMQELTAIIDQCAAAKPADFEHINQQIFDLFERYGIKQKRRQATQTR